MHLQTIKGLPANVHGVYLMILEFEVRTQIFSVDPSLTLVSEAPPDLEVQHVHIIQRIRQYTVKKQPSLYSLQLFIEVVTCEMIYLYI